MAVKIPTIEEIKKELNKRYIEFTNRLIRDGEVFTNSKGEFVEPEKIELRKDKIIIKITDYDSNYDSDLGFNFYKCASCDKSNIIWGHNYCPMCGIKIEWDIMTDDENFKYNEELDNLEEIFDSKKSVAKLWKNPPLSNMSSDERFNERRDRKNRIEEVNKWHDGEIKKLKEKFWHKSDFKKV